MTQVAALPLCLILTGAELPREKKVSCIYACRVASVMSKSVTLWTVACQASRSRDSPGKNTGVGFPILVENYISCCCKLPTPLNIWCCQGTCDPSSCSTSTPGTHWDQGPAKSSRTALGANPVDVLHTEMKIKPQLKPRGSMAKKEDPKPSYQLYKLQIKSMQSTR